MSLFAVTREAGPGWTDGVGVFEQPGVNDHGGYMNGLAEEGLVLFAGPLAGTEQGRIRVLLIADAESEGDIRERFAGDPWELSQQLVTTNIEPWNVLVGADRLTAGPTGQ